MGCPKPLDGKGGCVFQGGSLHDGFDGFGGSEEHLALLLLVLQNTVPRDDCDSFGGFGGFPPNLRALSPTPLFRHPLGNARPATGIQTPKPEIPRKKLKNHPQTPTPKFLEKNSKNTKKTRKIVFSEYFAYFSSFFQGILGSGSGGDF